MLPILPILRLHPHRRLRLSSFRHFSSINEENVNLDDISETEIDFIVPKLNTSSNIFTLRSTVTQASSTSTKGTYKLGKLSLPSVTTVSKRAGDGEILYNWKLKIMREHFISKHEKNFSDMETQASTDDVKELLLESQRAWQQISRIAANKVVLSQALIFLIYTNVQFTQLLGYSCTYVY